MRILEYAFYRMYNAYQAKNDSPFFSTFIYITFVEFSIAGSAVIFIRKMVSKLKLVSESSFERIITSFWFWGGLAGIIFIFTYLWFFTKDQSYYENKFDHLYTLNRFIKVWMLILLPFVILLFAVNFYILLFGGSIFKHEITGILE